jgi:hypothetical protein
MEFGSNFWTDFKPVIIPCATRESRLIYSPPRLRFSPPFSSTRHHDHTEIKNTTNGWEFVEFESCKHAQLWFSPFLTRVYKSSSHLNLRRWHLKWSLGHCSQLPNDALYQVSHSDFTSNPSKDLIFSTSSQFTINGKLSNKSWIRPHLELFLVRINAP